MYLPGIAGSYASTPDAAALDVTGDIDIRCHVALKTWIPAAAGTALVSKYAPSLGSEQSYLLFVMNTGTIRLVTTSTGANPQAYTSSVSTGLADGVDKWIRATRVASTGVTQFFTSADGSSWSQLGTDAAGTSGSIYSSAAPLEVGSYNVGALYNARGTFYRAQVLNGIGGTVVFDADFSDRGLSFTEDSSNHAPVTIYGRCYEPTWLPAQALYGIANHYIYEAYPPIDPEPIPATRYPAVPVGTTYPAEP
jgi:hypothetical protein